RGPAEHPARMGAAAPSAPAVGRRLIRVTVRPFFRRAVAERAQSVGRLPPLLSVSLKWRPIYDGGMPKGMTSLPNPYKGRSGVFSWVNRVLYPIMGQAQVGIGRPEAPYVPPENPVCPMCSMPIADHEIVRGDAHKSTRLTCPVPAA